MMLLLGSIGWGLLAIGAVTHVWHHGRLRMLLAQHVDHERVPAVLLTGLEVLLAVMLPVALFVEPVSHVPFVIAAALLAIGFCAWIVRLLFSGSTLPCACSFSDAPTTAWSLARAAAVLSVIAFFFGTDESTAMLATALSVGLAIGSAIFVLPDALAWPAASKAVLARSQAHKPASAAAAL